MEAKSGRGQRAPDQHRRIDRRLMFDGELHSSDQQDSRPAFCRGRVAENVLRDSHSLCSLDDLWRPSTILADRRFQWRVPSSVAHDCRLATQIREWRMTWTVKGLPAGPIEQDAEFGEVPRRRFDVRGAGKAT